MTTITNGYCTLQQLSETMSGGVTLQADSDNYMRAINTASRWIDSYCGRRFYADGVATARTFDSCGYVVYTDDISTTSGLIVKTNPSADGTSYGTTITSYRLWPQNGVGANGASGWPYTSIQLISNVFTTGSYFPAAQITANWGWAAVPDDVQQACLHAAEFVYKAKDAPFGASGIGELGITRAKMPSIVIDLLSPYRVYGAPGTAMVG